MPYTVSGKMNIFGSHDEPTIKQLEACLDTDPACRGVLCADGHLGYSMPIGGVVAYRDWISPSGVGYDIACGNKAARTDITWGELQPDLERVLDIIQREISFGVGRSNKDTQVEEHALFDRGAHPGWEYPFVNKLKRRAQSQLGTVGSGNHYVDLFVEVADGGSETSLGGLDPMAAVWIGCHFGSRGLGHTIASGFLSMARGGRFEERVKGESMLDAPTMLKVGSELGDAYLACMDLAGAYAYAGRDYVTDRVLGILGARSDFEVHNHHNFAWLEQHEGESLWVVRKGATPAWPGQWGFIGGSMADIAVIVRGVASVEAQAALNSTVHGAGRTMSRTRAAGRFKRVDGVRRRTGGEITPDMMHDAVRRFGVSLRGAGTDESPYVYKNLQSVLDAHEGSLEVVHALRPVGVIMAGEDEHDPFAD